MGRAQEALQGMREKVKETGTQALERAEQTANVPLRAGEEAPGKVYMAGVVGSILASLGLMLAGKTTAGIFVGLWAPTILNLGLFNKLLRPSQESLRAQGAPEASAAMPGSTGVARGEYRTAEEGRTF